MSIWGEVGVAAGLVHDALKDKGEPMGIHELSKLTGLDSSTVYMALGWLLREYKVTVDRDGRRYLISLGRKG
ncbi:MAG: winged helix-turn-helix domain-containing protein [Candidatus Altiarchaeota archaeon]|nr:winged helix-turn-helix domain-containing protein [Candidatus Altiarchaeota archaeon]